MAEAMTERATVDIRIPAYSPVMDEYLIVTVPHGIDWEDRVKALAVHTVYGADYDRRIMDTLFDLSRQVRSWAAGNDDMLLVALRNLDACERWAGTRSAGSD